VKIVFAGSPQYAVPTLKALVGGGKQVVAVITQPDKPVGRKRELTPTPVKAYALSKGIPVLDCEKIRDHVDELKAFGGDVMITCAYGQILTKQILELFPLGVWNLHASLLPLFRGASPIQSAILAGEKYTGVTVMRTELSLDTGAILLVKRCETGNVTCGELSEKLSYLSAEAAMEALKLIEDGDPQTLIQDEAKATYCKKIQKSDAKINFADSAKEAVRLINAMNPSPVAYCNHNGEKLNIYKAEFVDENAEGKVGEVIAADKKNGIEVCCGKGVLKILSAQVAGGKVLSCADLINGRKIVKGELLD
jgi:methionyl-tRNA formyltransferase